MAEALRAYNPLHSHHMSSSLPSIPSSSDSDVQSWLQIVERKVNALRFGSVQIVVHEGRVTQIESTEKYRFQTRSNPEAAPAVPATAGQGG